jgi:uncharacterized BrkB/YihY/UPF0761 family membrane protein
MKSALLSPHTLWSILKESVSAWIDDFAPSMGAAIAYYTAFSIAPLIIIVIAIAGFVLGNEAASEYLYAQVSALLGDEGGRAVQGMVNSASSSDKGAIATVIGVVLLIVGATTVFAELQTDLDRIWKAPAATKPEGLWALVRSRLLSLGLVVSIGFLVLRKCWCWAPFPGASRRSIRHFSKRVFVMQATEDRFCEDERIRCQSMAVLSLRNDLELSWRIWHTGSQRTVRTSAVVMRRPRFENRT